MFCMRLLKKPSLISCCRIYNLLTKNTITFFFSLKIIFMHSLTIFSHFSYLKLFLLNRPCYLLCQSSYTLSFHLSLDRPFLFFCIIFCVLITVVISVSLYNSSMTLISSSPHILLLVFLSPSFQKIYIWFFSTHFQLHM